MRTSKHPCVKLSWVHACMIVMASSHRERQETRRCYVKKYKGLIARQCFSQFEHHPEVLASAYIYLPPTILGLMNTKTALATITWQQRPLARCLRISLMVKTTMRQLHKNRGRVLPSSPKAASRRSQDKHESCRIGFPRGAGVLFQLLQISVSLIIHQFFGDFAERERQRERSSS